MSTLAQQRRILAVSAMVTLGVGVLAGVERGQELPEARFLIGLGLAFTVCSILLDLGLGLGAAFALLIMLVAVLTQGDDALRLLTRRSGREDGRRRRGRTQARR